MCIRKGALLAVNLALHWGRSFFYFPPFCYFSPWSLTLASAHTEHTICLLLLSSKTNPTFFKKHTLFSHRMYRYSIFLSSHYWCKCTKMFIFCFFFVLSYGWFKMTEPNAPTCPWKQKVLELSFQFFPHYSGFFSDGVN